MEPDIGLKVYWESLTGDDTEINYSVFLKNGDLLGRVALQGIDNKFPELAIIIVKQSYLFCLFLFSSNYYSIIVNSRCFLFIHLHCQFSFRKHFTSSIYSSNRKLLYMVLFFTLWSSITFSFLSKEYESISFGTYNK